MDFQLETVDDIHLSMLSAASFAVDTAYSLCGCVLASRPPPSSLTPVLRVGCRGMAGDRGWGEEGRRETIEEVQVLPLLTTKCWAQQNEPLSRPREAQGKGGLNPKHLQEKCAGRKKKAGALRTS